MTADRPRSPAPRARGRLSPRAAGASWLWAVTPLLTFGFGTWAAFVYGAARRRSAWLGAAAAGYAAALALFVALEMPDHPSPVAQGVAGLAWLTCVLGGAAHALAVRGRVAAAPEPRLDEPLRRAAAAAIERRELRQEARALAARDPVLARELGIGRPDLRRDYDDGGLVDVNSAPAEVLSTLPGMTAELSTRAVALRRERGAFVSADDMSHALGLPPSRVPDLAEKTIYPS